MYARVFFVTFYILYIFYKFRGILVCEHLSILRMLRSILLASFSFDWNLNILPEVINYGGRTAGIVRSGVILLWRGPGG